MKYLKRSIVESEMNRRVLDTRQKLRATMSLVKYDSISGSDRLRERPEAGEHEPSFQDVYTAFLVEPSRQL